MFTPTAYDKRLCTISLVTLNVCVLDKGSAVIKFQQRRKERKHFNEAVLP